MVGPSLGEAERRTASRRLRFGFVGLVGVSAGLVALAGDATPAQALLAAGGGLLAGGALTYYLVRVGGEWRR